jgi:hypothetical protein
MWITITERSASQRLAHHFSRPSRGGCNASTDRNLTGTFGWRLRPGRQRDRFHEFVRHQSLSRARSQKHEPVCRRLPALRAWHTSDVLNILHIEGSQVNAGSRWISTEPWRRDCARTRAGRAIRAWRGRNRWRGNHQEDRQGDRGRLRGNEGKHWAPCLSQTLPVNPLMIWSGFSDAIRPLLPVVAARSLDHGTHAARPWAAR